MFAIHAFVKHRFVLKVSRASSRASLYHIKNVFLFLHVLFTCPFRWNMSTGKRTAFTQCIEHLVKHSMIRNSAHRKLSTVFFNSSSGTAIAAAINIHHISISAFVKMCGIFHNTPTMSLSTVTTANWRFAQIHIIQLPLSPKPFRMIDDMFIGPVNLDDRMTGQN